VFARMAAAFGNWLKRFGRREKSMNDDAAPPSTQALTSGHATAVTLGWLADAPLFIDDDQVSAFYDAVVRPEGQQGKVTISLESFEGQTTKLGGTAGVEASVSTWIKTLLPFLDVKAKGELTAGREMATNQKKGESVEFYPIDNPHRQLIQLTLHYLVNLPERIRVIPNPFDVNWCDQQFIDGLPRALVFLDFPGETNFVPMAAEVDKGKVVTIYDRLRLKDAEPPSYPERQSFGNNKEAYSVAWTAYWQWFHDHSSAQRATETVESVVGEGGRVQWINYRVLPLGAMERPLHLDIRGRGRFDTGTFAYNLIKRGYNHGLRMVGTLKSEPDLNVLAIFEK
jgi:hypothetical protein